MNQKETELKFWKQLKIDEIKRELQLMRNSIATYEKSIAELKSDVCMHVYESHDAAVFSIKGILLRQAKQDCEGSHSCGEDRYNQEYTLNGSDIVFVGTLKVGYNRHDKTYYYVDDSEYYYKAK